MSDEQTKWSPEPWRAVHDDYGDEWWFGGDRRGGQWVIESVPQANDHDRFQAVTCGEFGEQARRIVAAVNAVAGIPTEALEGGALAALLDLFGGVYTQADIDAALRALGRLP
jgi:hypothetical protein